METILFILVALAMAWLIVWFCADRTKMDIWWPFDYRESETPEKDQQVPPATWRQQRQVPKRRWKRSGF